MLTTNVILETVGIAVKYSKNPVTNTGSNQPNIIRQSTIQNIKIKFANNTKAILLDNFIFVSSNTFPI